MTELLREYLPFILIALLVAAAIAYLVFRPRQRVRLTDSAPVRPHMANTRDSRKEANDIAAEAAAAASDVSGEIISAPVHKHLSNGPEAADNFQRIKGVGPRLAEMLQARGYTRFHQLARMTPEEIEMLDQQLGPFRGRIRRDRIAEQADYLARGDTDGFEQHFGRL